MKEKRSAGPQADVLTGVFQDSGRRFGFVQVEGRKQDIYIAEPYAMDAFHGDTVEVIILREAGGGRRAEGRITGIVERGVTQLVGTFERVRGFGFVIADDRHIGRDVFVDQDHTAGAVTGHKVVVRIDSYGGRGKNPQGEIVEILGHMDDPGVDMLSVVRAYGLETEFPDDVRMELENIAGEVSTEERIGRLDLRDIPTVTIDGEDAKDLDDAITLSAENGVYHLGVHIADVSHYVREGSALDAEALRRGTSVYLADRVIPMLPHQLSNGICSLNQGEDRLAFSCLMEIDENGNLLSHRLAESVIRVDRRMSYTEVDHILSGEEPSEDCLTFAPMFFLMRELSRKLREKRRMRGSIDFDLPESKIILDEDGVPVEIKPYEQNDATRLIEDFMLMANETVAEEFYWQDTPFLYRTHEAPDKDRMKNLAMLLRNFGYRARMSNEVHPGEIQKVLTDIEGSPEEAMISRLTLRSLKRACYSTDCIGHFGLAARYYTHFTSPIRRYPDLQIHRIMKEVLAGRMDEARIVHYTEIMPEVARQSSATERRADEAERETERIKKCQYMEGQIGRCFDGVISGVTEYGMFVELTNTVEGFIHVSRLEDDYYDFDSEQNELIGERSGRRFRLGERIRVKTVDADHLAKTVDFVPVKARSPKEKRKGRRDLEVNEDGQGQY